MKFFFEADIVGIPQISDVLSEFLLEGLDKALRRKVRSATVRVVNDRNIVDVEKVARNADRSLRAARGAAAGNHHRKDGGVRAYVLFAVLAHKLEDFARIDLIGQCLGDSGRNPSCYPRIEAMNHHGLEIRNDLAEFRPGLPQVEIWLAADDRFVERFNRCDLPAI